MTQPPPAIGATLRSRIGLVLVLGTLTIMAPLSVDMYLPALPALAKDLGVSQGDAQLTLTTYMLGFAIGQAFYGPVIDRFGRKPPLYFGMALYGLSSFGCAFVPSIHALMAFRFIQAVGACSGGVVSRAIVRDLFNPTQSSKVFAMLTLVTGLGPLLAPLAGGYMLIAFGWRSIFFLLSIITVVLLTIVHFRLKETYRPTASLEARAQAFSVARIVGRYARLLVDRRYLGYVLCSAFPMAGIFLYVSGAPFVVIELFHVPPQNFGWIFGANAILLITGSQLNGYIVGRVSPSALLKQGIRVQAVATALLVAHGLTGWGGLFGFLIPIGLYTACLGFITSNAMVLAMAPFAPIAGMASALLGTVQFFTSAVAASLMSLVHTHTALPVAAGMAICAICSLAVHTFFVRKLPPPEDADTS